MRKMMLDKVKRGHTLTIALGITALAIVMLAGIAGAAPYAYITNIGTDTVSVIDTSSNTIVDTVNGFDIPFGSAVARTEQRYMWQITEATLSL